MSSWIDSVSAEVSRRLPNFDAASVRHCAKRRVATLAECVNLSPAATGSTSLAHGMMQPSSAFALYHNVSRNKTGFPSQAHGFTPKDYAQHAKKHGLPTPRCFIMAVRDPVSRMASAYRDDMRLSHRLTSASHITSHSSVFNTDTSTWLDADPENITRHTAQKWNLTYLYSRNSTTDMFIRNVRADAMSNASRLWRKSVAAPRYHNVYHSMPQPEGGSFCARIAPANTLHREPSNHWMRRWLSLLLTCRMCKGRDVHTRGRARLGACR